MSKVLNTDDVLSLLQTIGRPEEVEAVEQALLHAAQIIADHYNVDLYDASYQPGFAGLCAVFKPIEEGQECPEALGSLDEDGDWE